MRLIRTIFYGLRGVWLDERVPGLLRFAFSMIELATVTFWVPPDSNSAASSSAPASSNSCTISGLFSANTA